MASRPLTIVPLGNSESALAADALAAIAIEDMTRAIALVQQLNAQAQETPIALHLVGLLSLRLNEPGKALEALEQAHKLAPDIREPSDTLAIVYSKVGRLVDSLFYIKLATAAVREYGLAGLVPDWLGTFDEAFMKIEKKPFVKEGRIALEEGRYNDAAEAFRRDVEVDKESVEGWRGLVEALTLEGRLNEAAAAARSTVATAEATVEDHIELSRRLTATGRFDEALAVAKGAAERAPSDPDANWSAIQAMMRRPGATDAALASVVAQWTARFAPPVAPPDPAPVDEFSRRRLRLGVMSGHWRNGGGLDLLVPVLEKLDRRRVELFVYAYGQTGAPLARRLRGRSDTWHELSDLDDETAAFVMRNDAIDALIELDGLGRLDRPFLLAQRPAARMYSAYRLPESARALGFDGAIGDALAYAPDAQAVRIEGGFATLPADLSAVSLQLPDPVSGIVFGAVAEGWQISEPTIRLWSALLQALPAATLVLDMTKLGGQEAALDLLTAFSAHLPEGRVLVTPGGGSVTDYLALVSLLLDPLDNPHPDELIAAAGMGVPSLTMRSALPRANVAGGWLQHLGLGQLVAEDADAYQAKAIELAAPEPLKSLRASLAAAIAAEQQDGARRQAAHLLDVLTQLVTTPPSP